MSARARLFSSTFLSSLASVVFGIAQAFAGSAPPAQLPAVDGVNGTGAILGGGDDTKGLFAGAGSLAVPLGGQYGAELDGVAGSFDGRFLGGGAGHLFWRNPTQGLLGAYGDGVHFETPIGGVGVGHVGGEGEAYVGQWTFRGVAGAEFGNNAATSTSAVVGTIPGGRIVTSTTVNGALTHVTRFFDTLTLEYYVTDNWGAWGGQRYLGGKNAAAFGTEYALSSYGHVLPTLFAEGRVGEGSNNYGVWGGLRLYFGNHDKTLIRRNREDDPQSNLFDIVDALGSGSTTTSSACPPGTTFIEGVCFGELSDCRLKRDVMLLARLDNGIGIYRYRYPWSDTVYVGVMAQEVARIVPDAVMQASDGYFRVNYARLGLRMMTWNEWTARRSTAALAA
jgi:hypothetical protein